MWNEGKPPTCGLFQLGLGAILLYLLIMHMGPRLALKEIAICGWGGYVLVNVASLTGTVMLTALKFGHRWHLTVMLTCHQQ